MKSVLFCIDSASLMSPELVGLEGENLGSFAWLEATSLGVEARQYLRSSDASSLKEAWVLSSDDLEPINLAAGLKHERSGLPVTLVVPAASSSIVTRAQAASIDKTITLGEFLRHYAQTKRSFAPSIQQSVAGATTVSEPEFPPPATGLPVVPMSPSQALDPWAMPSDETPAQVPSFEVPPVITSEFSAPSQPILDPATAPAPVAEAQFAPPTGAPVVPGGFSNQTMAPESGSPLGKKAILLPVMSASGGCGKSTVSLLLALRAAASGVNTCLMDWDLQYGDLNFLLGKPDAATISDGAANPDLLSSQSVRIDQNLSFLAAPGNVEDSETLVESLDPLLKAAQSTFDLIVVNTSSHWSDVQMSLLDRCHMALFLMDQRASSVRACQKALQLCTRCGVATSALVFALNRCSKNCLISPSDASTALKGVPVAELKDGGKELEEMLGAGLARNFLSTKNEFNQSLAKLFEALSTQVNLSSNASLMPMGGKNSKRKSKWATPKERSRK